jgi:glutathione synthase/RimK-type ligase-like ATP-grasp enzyme
VARGSNGAMTKRILIVTNRSDLHADLVAARLVQGGASPFRIDLDDFPAGFEIALQFERGCWDGGLTCIRTADRLPVSEIGAVWMRKKADFSFTTELSGPQEKAHAQGETEHILLSLLHSLDCYWMSHPLAVRAALWKGEQLLRASRMGFAVPPSLATNRPAAVQIFNGSAEHGIVFKSLSSPTLAAEEVAVDERIAGSLPTTRITEEHDDALEAVSASPCFFQHYVPKAYEVRATVIGEKVFAARIDSQTDARTATDYRDFSAEISYEAEALPPDIERRCVEFVHSYGLTFGAIDLIATPAGDHVFLENNPVGQFLFVEQLVPELDMTGAVASCLTRGAEAH